MSSPTDQSGLPPLAGAAPTPLLHVLLGEGEVSAVEHLLASGEDTVRLRGERGDGRRLLELVATAPVVTWAAWTPRDGREAVAAPGTDGSGWRS